MPATSYRFAFAAIAGGTGMLSVGTGGNIGGGPGCMNEAVSDGETSYITTGALNPSFECNMAANPNTTPVGGVPAVPIANVFGMVLRIAARKLIVTAVSFNYTLKNQLGTTVKTGTITVKDSYTDVLTPNGYWEIALSPTECAALSNSTTYLTAALRFDTFTGLHLFVNDECRITWAELSVPIPTVGPGCTVLRIDNENKNSDNGFSTLGAGTPIFDEAAGKIYFVYTCTSSVDGGAGGDNHSKSIFFRAFDIETETFDSLPVYICGLSNDPLITSIGSADAVGMTRDPVTGRIYVVYGDIIGCSSRHSDDNGATWSTREQVTGDTSFQEYITCQAAPNGDIFVWTEQQAGGGGIHDTYVQKRNHVSGLWSTVSLFDDGGVVPGISAGTKLNQAETIFFDDDSLRALAVFSRLENGTPNTSALRCYTTINGWGAISTVDIKTWNPYNTATHPIVRRGVVNTNRFWVMWIEALVPYFAYSDDWGHTWTQVGTPPAMAGYGWDEAYDRAFFIDYADRLYSSVFGFTGISNKHTAWVNADGTDLNGWTADDCTLDLLSIWTDYSATVGYSWYTVRADNTTRFYRAFNRVWQTMLALPSGYHTVSYDLLIKTDFVPPPPPPIEPDVPLPDANRMFRRGVLQAQDVNIPQRRANAVASIERAVRPPGVD